MPEYLGANGMVSGRIDHLDGGPGSGPHPREVKKSNSVSKAHEAAAKAAEGAKSGKEAYEKAFSAAKEHLSEAKSATVADHIKEVWEDQNG